MPVRPLSGQPNQAGGFPRGNGRNARTTRHLPDPPRGPRLRTSADDRCRISIGFADGCVREMMGGTRPHPRPNTYRIASLCISILQPLDARGSDTGAKNPGSSVAVTFALLA